MLPFGASISIITKSAKNQFASKALIFLFWWHEVVPKRFPLWLHRCFRSTYASNFRDYLRWAHWELHERTNIRLHPRGTSVSILSPYRWCLLSCLLIPGFILSIYSCENHFAAPIAEGDFTPNVSNCHAQWRQVFDKDGNAPIVKNAPLAIAQAISCYFVFLPDSIARKRRKDAYVRFVWSGVSYRLSCTATWSSSWRFVL